MAVCIVLRFIPTQGCALHPLCVATHNECGIKHEHLCTHVHELLRNYYRTMLLSECYGGLLSSVLLVQGNEYELRSSSSCASTVRNADKQCTPRKHKPS
jgi:hypothetical protein